MDELNPTVREQEIYEEMELTPEMIKSIRTLCATCLRHFVEAKAFKIALVPSADRSMDTCTVCQTRRGHDYVVIQKLKPIIRSAAAYAPPEVVDGKPPVYPYTPIKSDFEDAETVEEMMLYTELQSAVHAMIQRLEYSFTFNPSLLTSPKRKKQVAEILTEAEKYIWRIKEEMRCA